MCIRRCLTYLVLTWAPLAYAQTFKPYPDPEISLDQWQQYFEAVSHKFASTENRAEPHHLVVYSDASTLTYYTFTLPGHPAHPSWIARQIIEGDDNIDIEQVGYFAGSKEHFEELLDAYQILNAEIRRSFNEAASEQ